MILFNGVIQKIQTLADGDVRITLDYQGNCPPEMMGDFYKMRLRPLSIGMNDSDAEITKLPDAPEPPKSDKSPSKRLRDVLFRLWEVDSKGHPEFDYYYEEKMESIINHYKNKLP